MNTHKSRRWLNILRLSILSILIFILSPVTALAHWHLGYSHDSSIDTSNPDWMASIADSRTLSMLSLPRLAPQHVSLRIQYWTVPEHAAIRAA